MNGLDLFSGIGGISLALREHVRPIAYCEIDKYCQAVLLSRMFKGELQKAPIWDDIMSLDGTQFFGHIDIIYGGFPCQDISIAGAGKGLEGKRSGLFFEIIRLAKEIKPSFIFLENVPAITTRGGVRVVREITEIGYDCRWCIISASSIGALHRRERWFLLAHSSSKSTNRYTERTEKKFSMFTQHGINGYPDSEPSKQTHSATKSDSIKQNTWGRSSRFYWPLESREHWQETVSEMGKCSHGIQRNLDTIDLIEGSMLIYQYASTNEICPEEVLSLLQRGNIASSLQEWETSGTSYIPEEEILFEFLRLCVQKCKQASSAQELISQSSPKTPREFLRSMRSRKKLTSASCGSQSQEQRTFKHPNSLQDLSQLLAQSFKSAWIKKCREDAQDHIAQLRALGNAVVPEQAKKAFETLIGLNHD